MPQQAGRAFGAAGAVVMLFSLLITLFPFSLSARAFELDGRMREPMWAELEPFTVIELRDEPNCSVDLAKIYVCFDERDLITCIGFRFTHKAPTPKETEEGAPDADLPILTGVAAKVEDKDFLTFTTQNADSYNGDDYHIQGAAFPLSDTGTTAEVFIGQKFGFGDPLHVQLRFYDADGVPSNVYPLEIRTPTPQTTAITVGTTAAPPQTAKPITTRTTTEKRTTTRRVTTEKTTVPKTTVEKTTVPKTTAERTIAERAAAEQTAGERTTREKTTKEKTTKTKTTRPPKTTVPKTTGAQKDDGAVLQQAITENNELLQEVMVEQIKTKKTLYIAIGALLVAAFVVCFRSLKPNDD